LHRQWKESGHPDKKEKLVLKQTIEGNSSDRGKISEIKIGGRKKKGVLPQEWEG